mmetsp:Transcript_3412/g.10010  ORF Transcript_3412/g.10010 Transcript_3412/m.10010 type:complete len:254 (+) Transcript_3412:293-1054(+)
MFGNSDRVVVVSERQWGGAYRTSMRGRVFAVQCATDEGDLYLHAGEGIYTDPVPAAELRLVPARRRPRVLLRGMRDAMSTLLALVGAGLPAALAASALDYLSVDRVRQADVTVASASSVGSQTSGWGPPRALPLSVLLAPDEDTWWLSESVAGGVFDGDEWVELRLPGLRRVCAVGLRIKPMPRGPCSVRDFEVHASDGRGFTPCGAFQTSDTPGLQEFLLEPPVDARAVRIVCVSTAVVTAPRCGLLQVALF